MISSVSNRFKGSGYDSISSSHDRVVDVIGTLTKNIVSASREQLGIVLYILTFV